MLLVLLTFQILLVRSSRNCIRSLVIAYIIFFGVQDITVNSPKIESDILKRSHRLLNQWITVFIIWELINVFMTYIFARKMRSKRNRISLRQSASHTVCMCVKRCFKGATAANFTQTLEFRIDTFAVKIFHLGGYLLRNTRNRCLKLLRNEKTIQPFGPRCQGIVIPVRIRL